MLSHPRFALLLFGWNLWAASFVFAADTKRDAWSFRMMGQDVSYVKQTDGQWIFARPGKSINPLEEVERSDDEIILQNVKSNLFIKLTDKQAFWRQPKQETWTKYYMGSWSAPAKTVQDWIESQQPKLRAVDDNAYEVRVIYFVPSDREPTANWEEKTRTVVHFVDSMYQNDLQSKRLKTDGLIWEMEGEQKKIHLVRGSQPASFYNAAPAYDKNKQFRLVGKELRENGFGPGQLRLVFCENYDLGPADMLWNGTLALGAYESARGGLAMFSAHILRDEFCDITPERQIARFFDQTPVAGRRAMGHRMNSPRAEFVEDGFGAVIHELGHALGLPHDFRDHDRHVMSNGFRQIRRNLTSRTPKSKRVTFSDINTLLLMSSRYLNSEIDREDNTPPKIGIEVLSVNRTTARVKLKLTASDDNGLRAFAIHDQNAEAYVAGDAIEGQEFEKEVTVVGKPKDGSLNLTLIVVDAGGNQSREKRELR